MQYNRKISISMAGSRKAVSGQKMKPPGWNSQEGLLSLYAVLKRWKSILHILKQDRMS